MPENISKKDKPQIEFIVTLYKIKDSYQKYDLDCSEDIDGLISFYQGKDEYNDDALRHLQVKCEIEWQKFLIKLCENIIKKIEGNKKREKIYSKELKEAKIKKQKIKNNNLKLGDYDGIFIGEIEPLKQEFDSKWEKDKIEWTRFWLGLGIGFILGVIGSVLVIFLN